MGSGEEGGGGWLLEVGEGVCLQPSTGGWMTNTANHANAERTKKWKRVVGSETEDEHHADEGGTTGIESVRLLFIFQSGSNVPEKSRGEGRHTSAGGWTQLKMFVVLTNV